AISVYSAEMLSHAGVALRARSWIDGLRKRRGHGRVAARSLGAAEAIESSLRSLCSSAGFLGAGKVAREQFAQMLSDDLCERTAASTMLESVLPFTLHAQGSPLATEAARLIVPRMTEGGFPSRAVETLFFGDWKEDAIRRIFPDAEDLHARESYSFETMIQKCRGAVTLIMPAVTDEGAETIPSPFADRFLTDDAAPKPTAACALGRTDEGLMKKEMERLVAVESARIEGLDPLESRLGPFLGVLASKEARGMVRERFVEAELNPTSLERYANCPFSFFAQDVLRTVEEPEETPQIRATDRGGVVHEILARFYRDHMKEAVEARSDRPDEKKVARTISRIARTVWEERQDDLGYVKPGLREREIDEAAKMALCVVAAEADEALHISSPLMPREFEWEFSKKNGNALEIDVKGQEPLFVRGRVDRIDADSAESRFLVIDYKTGKEDQVVNRIESGEHLQLPLYIAAVKKSLYPKALPIGGLLVEIKETTSAGDEKKTPGKTKGLVLGEFDGACFRLGRSHAKIDEERMAELMDAAQSKSAEFASKIRNGFFPASNEAFCDYCNYGDICRHKKVSAD
ncbi:MAG: PD-(D/E)XK nuclease family protein, partial [bacterium]